MRRNWSVFAASLLLAASQLASAQQTGVIAGRVTNKTTGQPVADASVIVVGTVWGARTGEDGKFRIGGVPAGSHDVRASRIGYTAATRQIAVSGGQDQTLDFALAHTPVTIDEVVVTATGEQQRKRESGNAVSTVDVTPERLANVTTISQLLTAKAPGVYVNSPGGTTGSASRIRIRGANSVSLTNEPLLLIDGARANSDIAGSGTIGVGGQQSSRLNDLNPDDIESIEIVKGPAAAALYGTAAANGVIQVRTRRGRGGRTRWTVHSEEGSQTDQTAYPANYARADTSSAASLTARGLTFVNCSLDSQSRLLCKANTVDSLSHWNPLEQASPFVTGWRTSNGASAAGGTDIVNYFVSFDVDHDQGVVLPNTFKRSTVRANLSAQLASNVSTQIFTNYASSRLAFPQNDNNILGVVSSGLLGSAFDNKTTRGYLAGQTPQEIFAIDTRENVERFVGSSQTTWQALPWLSATMQAGVDFLDRRNKATTPANKVFFNSSTAEGSRNSNTAQLWTYTANGSLTSVREVRPGIRSSTTAGVQFNRDVVQATQASGARLLAGTGSLAGTAARFAVNENNTDNRTLGALVQEQVAWRDRLFVTAALRTDNNSAFGSNFGWVKYPAASVSWVVSEEEFFPEMLKEYVSSLRLRSAYGASGQRPSFRDAITYYNTQTVTVAGTDVPGLQVGGTGNPNLRPEKSREFEFGFEVGVLNDRASIDFTSYNKRTHDLLIAKPLPPSLGISTTEFDNLGESSNQGVELSVQGRVFEFSQARLDVGVTAATNRNRLEKIGKLPNGSPIPPIVFGSQRHVQGYPLGGYWLQSYKFEDKNKDGIISRLNCPGSTQSPGGPECEMLLNPLTYFGNPIPRREASFSPRLTLMKNIEIAALVDYRGGFVQFNNTARFRCNFTNCQEAYDKTQPLWKQARNIGQLMGTDAGYIEDSHYTKLREMTVALLAPREWAMKARAKEMRLTLAGRNLHTWTKYTGSDPEVNSTPTANFSTSDFLTQPPLRVYSARLTLSF